MIRPPISALRQLRADRPRRRFPLSLAHLSTPDLHALQERFVREHGLLPAAVLKWHDFWPGGAWFQPFPENWVAVDIQRARSRKAPRWSVSIWGMDDIGVLKAARSQEEAFAVVRALPKPITWEKVREMGFEQW